MNKALIFIFLFFSLGSSANNNEYSTSDKAVKLKTTTDLYRVEFQISKIDNENYSFSIAIELDNGCYIISPFSNDTTYGHLEISYDRTDHLMVNDLLEKPASVEEFDPIVGESVKFVKENTTYEQQLKVLTSNDFELKGSVWFVLEPRCTPEEVNFIISYNAGEMKVRKA